MNKDINFEKNGIIFNYRVAIVIKKDRKLLVQKNSKVNHYTLPGGRSKLLENSKDTAIREFKEETGITTKFHKSIGMIENFFTSSFDKKEYHEILMLHELEFKDSQFYKKEMIANIEEKKKDEISYIWIDIENLKNSNFQPRIVLDILDKKEFQYCIYK